MTEAGSQLATLAPGEAANIDLAAHPGLVGRPLRGVEIRAGGIGEPEVLRVRGPMLFDGYAGAPAGAAPDADGWFTTGDRGYVDAAGMLYVTGRAGARIISGGENVEPGIVEALIRNSGLVGDVGLVGVPDEDWGQRVVALVESDRTAAELEAWARAHLEPAQRPRQWIRVDALPRNRTGKLRRDELLRLAGSK
jgi:acyl-CoA synthetase (AMP-forming)/AMP-acid ligase II